MFTRHPSAILRDGLDHGGRDTPATIVLKPRMLGNNAGIGSQTATHLAENSPVASWEEGVAVVQDKARSRSPCRRPLRGLSGRELRDRMSKQGLLRQQAPASSAGSKQQATQCTPIPVYADCGVWEFPPARPTAPGRKRYRRGSALKIQNFGSNPGEVLKAKSEYTDDKYAKSAVESEIGMVAKKSERTQCGGIPDHSGTSAALGVAVEEGWV